MKVSLLLRNLHVHHYITNPSTMYNCTCIHVHTMCNVPSTSSQRLDHGLPFILYTMLIMNADFHKGLPYVSNYPGSRLNHSYYLSRFLKTFFYFMQFSKWCYKQRSENNVMNSVFPFNFCTGWYSYSHKVHAEFMTERWTNESFSFFLHFQYTLKFGNFHIFLTWTAKANVLHYKSYLLCLYICI